MSTPTLSPRMPRVAAAARSADVCTAIDALHPDLVGYSSPHDEHTQQLMRNAYELGRHMADTALGEIEYQAGWRYGVICGLTLACAIGFAAYQVGHLAGVL